MAESDPLWQGLSSEEAGRRLVADGPNELPQGRRRGAIVIALEVAREPMFLLLVFGGTLYLLLGDLQEALMLLAFVFVVMGITVYQERKTERALDALRDLASPRALVVRDGVRRRIAGRDVVRGDLVILVEGDRIPADCLLHEENDLVVDESLLTGESVPVRKVAAERPEAGEMAAENPPRAEGRPRAGGDDSPWVFSGTLVVLGQGMGTVQATGPRTEMGRIGLALEEVKGTATPLQRASRAMIRALAAVGLTVCVVVVVAYALLRGGWLDGLLAGVTLAMATLPEEIPVILTVFLALGAWRISQRGVLTRRVPVVESLGATTVLCVDKTGTLTLNQMQVAALFAAGGRVAVDGTTGHLPPDGRELLTWAILASEPHPSDPMERAFRELGERCLDGDDPGLGWSLVHEYPLTRPECVMSHVWATHDGHHEVAAKGAPEGMATVAALSPDERAALTDRVAGMAADGLRVLAVARAHHRGERWPARQEEFSYEILGLIGLADPPRPTVPAALEECYRAGIRVVMITGDFPGTAVAVACRIGLRDCERVLTGEQIDALDDAGLAESVAQVNVFARVVPEQKLRLVRALRAGGELVAMTGDGVNDAPALKAADIGVAMGGRGTDVAREAASLVLLDDDFSSIVAAVRMGRRIFDNLKKAVAYVFAIHVPIIGLSLVPLLVGWPLILFPVHVVFLELIIDPACSIVFEAEPEEDNIMDRPPRDPRVPLFSRATIGLSILQGLGVLAVLLVLVQVSLSRGQSDEEVRALAFATLVVANVCLIFTNRSWSRVVGATLRRPNRALWWVVGGAFAFLALVLYVPALRDLFRFGTLHAVDVLLCLAAGLFSIGWFEFFKVTVFRRHAPA